jgi:hypothetical protein
MIKLMQNKLNKNQKILFLITLFSLVDLFIHYFTNATFGLHRDEYLYIAMKDHLDFGYVSIPPFTALIAKISNVLFGHSVFGYRILPSLAGAVTVFLTGLIVKKFKGSYMAITLACTSYILSSTFLHINFLLQPVTFDVMFWTLICYLVVRMIQTNNPKIWIFLGITVGIALLNKYSIVFLIAGIILALMLSQHRKFLTSKYFFIAILAGLIILLPNLIWQFKHNFPVVHHMTELRNSQLINTSAFNFIIDQLIMNAHALPIWITGLIVLLFYKEERQFQFISVFYFAVFLIIIIAKGKSYYTAGLYPLMFAAGGYTMNKYFTGRLRFIKYYFVFTLPLSGIITIPYGMPILKYEKLDKFYQMTAKYINYGPLRWEDGKIHKLQQDWADMTGWKELSDIVINAYMSLPAEDRQQCTIFASNYGEAGAIKYYTSEMGLPEPISFSDNFVLWAPDSVDTQYLIFVDWDTTHIKKLFKQLVLVGSIQDEYAREQGQKVFLCSEPTDIFKSEYISIVNGKKEIYRR